MQPKKQIRKVYNNINEYLRERPTIITPINYKIPIPSVTQHIGKDLKTHKEIGIPTQRITNDCGLCRFTNTLISSSETAILSSNSLSNLSFIINFLDNHVDYSFLKLLFFFHTFLYTYTSSSLLYCFSDLVTIYNNR